ncbi:MAG: hypothetical protein RJA24_200, partial [Pseudomonadota bacterium]
KPEQPLAILAMQEQAVFVRAHPATTFHLEAAAGLQRLMCELAIEIVSV